LPSRPNVGIRHKQHSAKAPVCLFH
jgi:hypothetical protein